jgi:hypothetical protein
MDFHLPRFFISSIGYSAIDRAVAAPMRNEWALYLDDPLKYAGIESSKYKAHSFRIGAATALSMAEYPIDEIKNLGRWKSTAYKS